MTIPYAITPDDTAALWKLDLLKEETKAFVPWRRAA